MVFLDWFLARLAEPSTYAGLAGILGSIGLTLTSGEIQALVGILTGAAGFAAMILKDKGGASLPPPTA